MLTPVTSLWTLEQTALSVIIVLACLWLALARHRPAQGSSTDAKAAPSRQVGVTGRRSSRVSIVVLAVVLVPVALFLVERGANPIGIRADSWSDANVVISGRNYARYGLLADAAAAQHQWTNDATPPDPFYRYSQYPVGSNLLNGMWQSVGVTSVRAFRLLPAACSITAVILWFGLYRKMVGAALAVVAAVTMASSYGFLAYADNLHFHAYAMLTAVAAGRAYVRAMDTDEPRRLRWFFLCATLMFVTALFTWEYHLWIVLFIALYALLFPCPVRRRNLMLLGLPLLAALALQTAQQRLSLADVRVARADDVSSQCNFLDDIRRRTIGFEGAIDTPPGLALSGYPAHLLLRYYKFYGLPAVAVVAVLGMLLGDQHRLRWRATTWSRGGRFVLILLVAGMGWWVVMMQHTAVHAHVMRQGLAGYALLMTLAWWRCWQTIRSVECGPATRLVAVILMGTLAYAHAEGLVGNVRLHHEDNFRDMRERSSAGVYESELFSRLESVVPPRAVIFTNHNRLPPMRLWSRRPVYWAHTTALAGQDPETSRTLLEMSFNHLRELHHDDIPQLYYVYVYWAPTSAMKHVFDADPLLRFLLLGHSAGGPGDWSRAVHRISRLPQTGQSALTFCPVVAAFDNLLVFDLGPAVRVFREQWSSLEFPTLREYGPPR